MNFEDVLEFRVNKKDKFEEMPLHRNIALSLIKHDAMRKRHVTSRFVVKLMSQQ